MPKRRKEDEPMKESVVFSVIGVVGSVIASWFGGWDSSLTTLLIFMGIDLVTGMMVAGIFKKSPKTKTGALESKTGWEGLCRKGGTLLVVLVACRLDLAVGTTFMRDASVIAFISNETISIIENAGLMGIPIPSVITRAIDVLQQKAEEDNKNVDSSKEQTET